MPAVANVVENCPREATDPESHPAASDVDVCATASVFVQVTVVPTTTSSSAGLKALFPRVDAPTGIVIGVEAAGVGVGVGGGVGGGTGEGAGAPPPHALASNITPNTRAKRNADMEPPEKNGA